MSDDGDKPKEGYEVGYKKPPKHSQFKPGESGRTRGRGAGPRRRWTTNKSLDEIVRRAALKTFKVKEGDRTRTIPLPELLITRILQNALTSNNPRQLKLALEMLERADAFGQRRMNMDELISTVTPEERAVIDGIREELAQYDTGEELPDEDLPP